MQSHLLIDLSQSRAIAFQISRKKAFQDKISGRYKKRKCCLQYSRISFLQLYRCFAEFVNIDDVMLISAYFYINDGGTCVPRLGWGRVRGGG